MEIGDRFIRNIDKKLGTVVEVFFDTAMVRLYLEEVKEKILVSKEHIYDCWTPVPVRAVPRITEVVSESADKTPRRNATLISNLVNHPPHYKDGGIEVIDYIEAKKLNYNLGNAVKYISRAGKKFPEELVDLNIKNLNAIIIQDLEKAVWYIQREITKLKRD